MRNDNIARSLRYYRNVNHKSIDDIIAFLREHDYDVSEKTIYAWENGSNQPRADILMLLCEYYQIDDVLTAFGYRDAETSFLQDPLSVSEISLIKSYREHKAKMSSFFATFFSKKFLTLFTCYSLFIMT